MIAKICEGHSRWEISPARCLIQCPLLASPGMVVKVSLQMPGTALIRMEGLVTWARESEFGIELLRVPVAWIEKGSI